MTAKMLTMLRTRDGKIHSEAAPNIIMTHDSFGCTIETFGNSQIHCESGPAIITSSGEKLYYCDGHRLTYEQYCERIKIEPHYRYLNGVTHRVWRSRETHRIHRVDGPAIETSDGSQVAWLINGRYHRAHGPAVVITNNLAVEERYYYNGTLHNPDGPAKVNYLTNRKTYYLNGKRVSKLEFIRRQRMRKGMKGVVCRKSAYQAYIEAYILFKSAIVDKSYKLGNSSHIMDLINDNSQLKSSIERRSASLGIYHALTKHSLSADEFTHIYNEVEAIDSPLFVIDAGDNDDLYELYLAAYCINRCDSESVFTTISSETELQSVISEAIDYSMENNLPTDYKIFVSASGDVTEATNDDSSEVFSWGIPLALAAGIGMLGKLYKKKSGVKKEVKEQVWTTARKT